MAYSVIWDETKPADSEAANTLGLIIRSLKRDVDERFIDIFAMPNFTADPLRPYGLKFTDVVDGKIFLGDNAGTPRTLSVRNKADNITYFAINVGASVSFGSTIDVLINPTKKLFFDGGGD